MEFHYAADSSWDPFALLDPTSDTGKTISLPHFFVKNAHFTLGMTSSNANLIPQNHMTLKS